MVPDDKLDCFDLSGKICLDKNGPAFYPRPDTRPRADSSLLGKTPDFTGGSDS